MHREICRFNLAACAFVLYSVFACSAASASGTTALTATIRTTEFMLPSADCASGISGIGAGVGKSNLFTKKPLVTSTSVVMTSSDCITARADGTIGPTRFDQGKFTLIGVGV